MNAIAEYYCSNIKYRGIDRYWTEILFSEGEENIFRGSLTRRTTRTLQSRPSGRLELPKSAKKRWNSSLSPKKQSQTVFKWQHDVDWKREGGAKNASGSQKGKKEKMKEKNKFENKRNKEVDFTGLYFYLILSKIRRM